MFIPTWLEMDEVLSVVPFEFDAKSEETLSDPVFKVEIFALVKFIVPDAKMFVVARAFETQTFPRIFTLAPDKPIEF